MRIFGALSVALKSAESGCSREPDFKKKMKKIRKKPRFYLTWHLFMNIIETMFSDIHEKMIITE